MKRICILILLSSIISNIAVLAEDEIVWQKGNPEIGEINDFAISPDESLIAQGLGKYVLLRDMEGRAITQLDGNDEIIQAIAFSPDGNFLYSGAGDENNLDYQPFIVQWNLADTLLSDVFEPNDISNYLMVKDIDISPDGKYMAALFVSKTKSGEDYNKTLFIWDITANEIVKSINYNFDDHTSKIKFSPDGKKLVVNKGGSVEIIAVPGFSSNGLLGKSEDHHSWSINDFSFSDDGSLFVTAGNDGYLKIWDISQNQLLESFIPFSQSTGLVSVEFGKENNFLLIATDEKKLSVFNIESKKNFYSYKPFDNNLIEMQIISTKNHILVGDGVSLFYMNVFYDLTGFNEDQLQTSDLFTIHPNPCSDGFYIRSSENDDQKINLEIYNCNGLFMFKNIYSLNSEERMDISKLSHGMYFLKIIDAHGNKYFKKLIAK